MELFTCERHRARLTVGGCVRMYLSAKARPPYPEEARSLCVACPIGARHAGEPIHEAESVARKWRDVCSRCRRTSTRHLIAGRLCISCYNRDREAALGLNAKGHRPALVDHLHPMRIIVAGEGGRPEVIARDSVLDAAEIAVDLAKKAKLPFRIGWPGAAHA